LTRAAPIDRAPQFRTFGVGYVLEYTLEFRAYRDSAYLLYVLLLLAPGPLVTLLEGQFSLVGRQAYSAKAGAEYLLERRATTKNKKLRERKPTPARWRAFCAYHWIRLAR
jgi:hypothetical protein